MLKKQLHKIRIYSPLLILLVLLLVVGNLALIPRAFAGTFTNSSIIEMGGASNVNPMIAGDGQSVAIAFTPATTTGATPTISLTFTNWTGSSAGAVNATQTISSTGCMALTGATAVLPGTPAASGNASTGVVTITGATTLTSGTTYCTELTSTSAVTNPSTAGPYSVTLSDGSDSITQSIDVLTSTGTPNSYTVGATVASTFTMSLGATSDIFATNPSTTTVADSNGVTTTINTNAANGWMVWAEDLNSGIKSTGASKTIASVASGSNYNFTSYEGTEGYGLGVSADNTTNYAYGGGTTGGALSNSTFYEIASSSTQATGVTFTTHELLDISSTTPAASDYADTITEIGAGSY